MINLGAAKLQITGSAVETECRPAAGKAAYSRLAAVALGAWLKELACVATHMARALLLQPCRH
jgi:hypothetical protein